MYIDECGVNRKGLICDKAQETLNTNLKTVWLSDDTLIKQIAHHKGQFDVEEYIALPEILNNPTMIKVKGTKAEFFGTVNGKNYIAVIKILERFKEIFLVSFRRD